MVDPDYDPVAAPAFDADDTLIDWLNEAGNPGGAPAETLNAADDILRERMRVIVEKGRTPEHDDVIYGEGPDGSALSQAASAYAAMAARHGVMARRIWPLDWGAGPKPMGARDALVCAAQLILADIERIDRAAAREAGADSAGEAPHV
ncbi:MAG: hypothetical protein Q8L84_10005 [Hyphomonas sp.]|nr:hypothetical protein [Hyphomonas sp.]